MASGTDGTYAPKSPDLSFLTSGSDEPPLPVPPTSHQQYNQQQHHHGRTPSADFANPYRGAAPAYPSNGAPYYHGSPAQPGFAGSPSFAYNSLPPSNSQPPETHMTSPPPHPASGFHRQAPPQASQVRYHDNNNYNINPLPPYLPPQQSPYHVANNAQGSAPLPQQQYSQLSQPQQPGYSPPQQAPHLPGHLPPSQVPSAYPHTNIPTTSPYHQHSPLPSSSETRPYPQSGPQDASSGAYPQAHYSNPASRASSNSYTAIKNEPPADMPPAKALAAAKQPEIMFSPVKTKFPTARIKRIMQADEEVGKVAQQTPIAVGKALELFMVQLVTKSADVARDKNSKRITAQMLKQVIDSGNEWDFLQDIVAKVTEEKEGAKGSAKAKAESETDEELEPVEPKKRGRAGRKKKGAE